MIVMGFHNCHKIGNNNGAKKKETTNETGVSRSQTPRTHPTIRGASSFTSTPELVLRLAAVTIPFILFSHILFLFGFLLEKYCRTVCCDYTKQLVEHAIISDDFHESAAFCMAHRCWWKTMTWPEKNAGKNHWITIEHVIVARNLWNTDWMRDAWIIRKEWRATKNRKKSFSLFSFFSSMKTWLRVTS